MPPELIVVWVAVIVTLSQPSAQPSTSTAPKPKSRITSPLRSARLSRRVEWPGPKWIVSAPAPPLTVSLPPLVTMMSMPSPAFSTLSRSLPISVSLPMPVMRLAIADSQVALVEQRVVDVALGLELRRQSARG